MDVLKQQQRNIDTQVCLKILKDKEYLYTTEGVYLDTHYVVFSSRFHRVGYYSKVTGIGNPLLPFDTIFQSFTDPERPTEEEFIMFKLQHGVDWIVEPLKLSSEGITK